MKLSELGFLVKEMIGGLDGWIRDGFAVETGRSAGGEAIAESGTKVACGC
jgi:hypothetical protein